MARHKLPFEGGEDIELRSFVKGFRGAWFRCKIIKIGRRHGHLSCAIEYRDFPDEKVNWEKIYQYNPAESKRTRKTRRTKTMMIRPAFPPIYQESKRPDINTISEAVVTVRDTWKVGDLVDWWKDGCHWSAKVVKVLGDKKVQVELPAPPVGEGETNEASCEDLRPSLDWSLENGWTVPTSKEKENGHPCAQLIKPDNQGIIPSLMPQSVGDGRMDVQTIAGAKPSLPAVDTSTAKTNTESDTGIVAGGVPSLIPQSVGEGKIDVQTVPAAKPSITAVDTSTAKTNTESDTGVVAEGVPSLIPQSVGDVRIDVQTVPGAKPSITAVDTSTAKTNTESDTGIVAGDVPSLISQSVGDGRIDVQTVPGAKPSLTAVNTPTATTNAESDAAYSESRRTSCSNSVPNLHVNDAATEMGESTALTNALDNNRSLKRMRTDEGIVLNTMSSDTFEAAICDLEELINRINWMQNALDNGMPLTGAMGPHWQILETIPQPPQDEGCHSLRYEDQKRRDWNTFGNYLKNRHPPLSLSCCSAAHVIEFLRYLDQFGKTKVHNPVCPFYSQSNPPAPCPCPLRQAWGSLDSIVGRLRAAFEENGGKPEVNPFGDKAIKLYLREIRDLQSRARGVHHKKGKMSPPFPSQPPPPRGANW